MTAHSRRNWRDTPLTRLLGIELPLVLAPFGGASSVELTALVSERGGLGSYGLYGYDAGRIGGVAAELRQRTSRPVALNLWLPRGDETGTPAKPEPDAEAFAAAVELLRPYYDATGTAPPAEPPSRYLPDFAEQFEAVLEARPAVLSLVFGVPGPDVLDRARERGIRVVATATTVDEAIALDRAGVDAIVASGAEAGGHRTSFLRPAEQSLVGTMALVPQIADAVSAPVIAAGGIGDARGVAAALLLGADAALLGTAFLGTRQSAAAASYRAVLHSGRARDTVLTDVMSGRLARGIPNRVVRELTEHASQGRAPAPFPVQNWLTGRFRGAASARDDAELLSLWAGQAAPLARHEDAGELIRDLVDGVDRLL